MEMVFVIIKTPKEKVKVNDIKEAPGMVTAHIMSQITEDPTLSIKMETEFVIRKLKAETKIKL